MTLLPNLCLIAFLGADASSLPLTNASPIATVQQAPQGLGGVQFKGGSSSPTGGTPEPGSILLLVGGALGYGAWRVQRKKNTKES